MEKLDKKTVLHVANLAKLSIDDKEIEKYSVQLTSILTEIDKINKVDIDCNKDILIAPTTNTNCFSEDIVKDMLNKDEVFKNANKANEEYIIVPKVIE
jgi:aspartyl-tRNA(Asn)/glutamyl-tRNA(Gln) amidotransferase subunit C